MVTMVVLSPEEANGSGMVSPENKKGLAKNSHMQIALSPDTCSTCITKDEDLPKPRSKRTENPFIVHTVDDFEKSSPVHHNKFEELLCTAQNALLHTLQNTYVTAQDDGLPKPTYKCEDQFTKEKSKCKEKRDIDGQSLGEVIIPHLHLPNLSSDSDNPTKCHVEVTEVVKVDGETIQKISLPKPRHGKPHTLPSAKLDDTYNQGPSKASAENAIAITKWALPVMLLMLVSVSIPGCLASSMTEIWVQQRGPAILGKDILLECVAKPPPPTWICVNFFKGGDRVYRYCSRDVETMTEKKRFFQIKNAKKSDGGSYTCNFEWENDASYGNHDLKEAKVDPKAGDPLEPSLQICLPNAACSKTALVTRVTGTGPYKVSCKVERQDQKFIVRNLQLMAGETILVKSSAHHCATEVLVETELLITCQLSVWDISAKRNFILKLPGVIMNEPPGHISKGSSSSCGVWSVILGFVICSVVIHSSFL